MLTIETCVSGATPLFPASKACQRLSRFSPRAVTGTARVRTTATQNRDSRLPALTKIGIIGGGQHQHILLVIQQQLYRVTGGCDFTGRITQDKFTIEAILHWSDATRLNHEFILRNRVGEVTTAGYSVQLLLDEQQNVLMLPPPYYADFRARWQAGVLS